MNELLRPFEPPAVLEDEQIEKLRKLQEATLHYAKSILELLPNVEDRDRALKALQDVKLFGDTAIRFGRTILTPAVLAEHFASVERKDQRVERVWMNSYTFADIRKWGRDIMDVESQMIFLKRGIMGRVWGGTTVCITRTIKPGFIVLISDVEAEQTKNADQEPGWVPTPDQLIKL